MYCLFFNKGRYSSDKGKINELFRDTNTQEEKGFCIVRVINSLASLSSQSRHNPILHKENVFIYLATN